MGFFSKLLSGDIDIETKRKTNLIHARIINLVESGGGNTIMQDIDYETAIKYALESGVDTKSPVNDNINDNIQFKATIRNKNCLVFFARQIDGSTYLGVDDADELTKKHFPWMK